MKTSLGYVAIIFGALGALVALVMAFALWPLGIAVSKGTEQFTTKAILRIDEVSPILNRLEVRASETAAEAEAVRKVVVRIVDENPGNDFALQKRAAEILGKLTPMFDRAESFGNSVESMGVMLKATSELGEKFAKDKGNSQKLGEVADRLIAAAAAIDKIMAEFAQLRSGKITLRGERITVMATQAGSAIRRVADGLAILQEQTAIFKDELAEVNDTVRQWSKAGLIAADLLLLWIGLGQVCMVRWGRAAING